MHALRLFTTVLFLLCVSAFGLLKPDPGSAAPGAVVDVFERPEVNQDKILLGHISRISGADSGLCRQLQNVEVGRSPLPGNSRRMDEGRIRVRLKQFNIDPSRVRLNVPENAEVVRGFTVVSKEKIQEVIQDYLLESRAWNSDIMRIREIRIKDDVMLPKGPVTFQLDPPKARDFFGKVPLAVNIAVGGEFQDKVWAVADIKVLREVIVATRPLKRHQEIAEADIQVRRMDMARLPSNFLTDFGEILGKRTSRSIDVNTVLRPDLVEFPPLVKRGDVVTVVAESTGLRITAVGVVKERNGRRGERIRVENIDSKKSIYAQVVDAKTVKIDF